ncbi:hypothetical protein GHT89_16635 [Acinetobacter baumannii]|uniref:hypothetical protein n=1 Tax=Acinetobacter baumannii TaxID=470 RepID=UPI00387DD1A5
MSNEIFDYPLPSVDELNDPEKKPNLLIARYFSMEMGLKKITDLNENEKAFLEYIQEHKSDYDITVNVRDDGRINCHIGSFNDHLIRNSFILWVPFFIISFFINYYHFFVPDISVNKLTIFAVGGVVFAIGLCGVPTSMIKFYFEKESFYKWYPALIIASVIAGFVVNF